MLGMLRRPAPTHSSYYLPQPRSSVPPRPRPDTALRAGPPGIGARLPRTSRGGLQRPGVGCVPSGSSSTCEWSRRPGDARGKRPGSGVMSPSTSTASRNTCHPKTFCVVDGDRFLAGPRTRSAGTAAGYGSVIADPVPRDGSRSRRRCAVPGAAVPQRRSSLRHRAQRRFGVVRAGGAAFHRVRLAETGPLGRLQEQISHSENLTPVVEVSGTRDRPREQFNFEDLLRGLRVEVWDDATSALAQPARTPGHARRSPTARSSTPWMTPGCCRTRH